MVASMLVVAAYVIVPVVLALIVVRLGNVVRYIPNDNVGIMEKIWSARGSVTGGFIALGDEASGGGSVGALLSGLMAASMLKLDAKLPLTNGDLR